MNFFDAQDKAKRTTRWLVVVYLLSTALIVAGVTGLVAASFYTVGDAGTPADAEVLMVVAGLATMLIVGSTLYKTAVLSSGGGRVARDLGGTLISPDVRDPLRRRLRNVVEEMAIASGVPVPEIYVLEEESGINAFAAGYTTGDAAVAVTRGCLELLDRDELQGVIAHEFSHILNGDMRLNIRMMGVLFGIMVVGMIGRTIIRSQRHSSLFSSRRNKNAGGIIIIGIGMALLGWVGVFMARLLKAAVSRQREFLADASAVQFTRQADGIADALKKIGGYEQHSYIQNSDPEEVSHMLFAGGAARLTSLFATHPPLPERIRALDPSFDESDYPKVSLRTREHAAESGQVSGFSSRADYSAATAASLNDSIESQVGAPQAGHVSLARQLRAAIPESLYEAAHGSQDSLLLAIALSLAGDPGNASRQLDFLGEQIGKQRADVVQHFHTQLGNIGPEFRLPLLEVAFPAVKNRPLPQVEFLIDTVEKLIALDGKIELREYCFYRILKCHLVMAADPRLAGKGNRVGKKAAQQAAIDLVSVVADQGNDDDACREQARKAGLAHFGKWATAYEQSSGGDPVVRLGDSLDTLSRINSTGKKSLLQAISATVTHDGKLSLMEAELLRTICAALDCPLPPILERQAIGAD